LTAEYERGVLHAETYVSMSRIDETFEFRRFFERESSAGKGKSESEKLTNALIINDARTDTDDRR